MSDGRSLKQSDAGPFPPSESTEGPTVVANYDVGDFHDEMFLASGEPRPACKGLYQRLQAMPASELQRRQRAAELSMLRLGITFNVYGESAGRERIFPFDILPRIIAGTEWDWIERGLKQRILALNCFLHDIYHEQTILRDGVVPTELVQTSQAFRPQCVGLTPPRGVWCHITGTDLVRDRDGQVYVLEDNLRCPSGVSYVLKNRQLVKQTFSQLFERTSIRPVDDYGCKLLEALQYLCDGQNLVALLSPGSFNSAYFEHSFLAQQMGIPLVEGRDLVVSEGYVFMRTTTGLQRVDVLYRRIDDDFLDPLVFRPDSMLGVSGLMEAYRAGNVAIANAPGTGVADDKAVYAYVPQIIKYYLSEDPLLPNVPTYVCVDVRQRQHVLANLSKMVIKPVNGAGGYGLVIGSSAAKAELEELAKQIQHDPRGFVAQPILCLSRVPVFSPTGLVGRHADLRPFIVQGKEIYVLPGGLTRVALSEGSLVVNSSRGGGSKDTWVVS